MNLLFAQSENNGSFHPISRELEFAHTWGSGGGGGGKPSQTPTPPIYKHTRKSPQKREKKIVKQTTFSK